MDMNIRSIPAGIIWMHTKCKFDERGVVNRLTNGRVAVSFVVTRMEAAQFPSLFEEGDKVYIIYHNGKGGSHANATEV
jgi:hypothetical protein